MQPGAIDFLLVDEDPRRRRMLRRVLRKCDYTPIAVSSAAELAVVLRQFDVRRVLVGASGEAEAHAQALRLLEGRKTRVLVLTDTGTPRRVAAYLRLGPHVRVVEPTPESITAGIRASDAAHRPRSVPRPRAYPQRRLGPLPGALGHAIVRRRTVSV